MTPIGEISRGLESVKAERLEFWKRSGGYGICMEVKALQVPVQEVVKQVEQNTNKMHDIENGAYKASGFIIISSSLSNDEEQKVGHEAVLVVVEKTDKSLEAGSGNSLFAVGSEFELYPVSDNGISLGVALSPNGDEKEYKLFDGANFGHGVETLPINGRPITLKDVAENDGIHFKAKYVCQFEYREVLHSDTISHYFELKTDGLPIPMIIEDIGDQYARLHKFLAKMVYPRSLFGELFSSTESKPKPSVTNVNESHCGVTMA